MTIMKMDSESYWNGYVWPAIFGAGIILSWELICRTLNIPEYMVPTPSRIFQVINQDFSYLALHASATLMEAVLGLVFASLFGFLFGILFAHVRIAERMIFPYFVASQAVPIVAVAPLFILWLGNGITSKVGMAALICFFPVTVNSSRGLRSISQEHIDLFRINAASTAQIFWKLRLPSSIGYLMTGLRVSASLAMIGAIVAEYAGANQGIGYVIMQATYRLDTTLLFAAILFSALGGFCIFGVVVFLDRYFFAEYSRSE